MSTIEIKKMEIGDRWEYEGVVYKITDKSFNEKGEVLSISYIEILD